MVTLYLQLKQRQKRYAEVPFEQGTPSMKILHISIDDVGFTPRYIR